MHFRAERALGCRAQTTDAWREELSPGIATAAAHTDQVEKMTTIAIKTMAKSAPQSTSARV
jgi:hypothetical protein